LNKQKFNSLLKNFNSINAEDLQGLNDLANSFPYSQVLHTLIAKASHDNKAQNASSALSRAAMYAADRQLLKSIILSPASVNVPLPEQKVVPKEAAKVKKEDSIQINQTKQVHISVAPNSYSQPSDLLRSEIWLDLKHLKESKANYLEWLEKSDDEVDTKKSVITKLELKKSKPATLKKAVSKVVKATKKATSVVTVEKETAGKATAVAKVKRVKETTAKKVVVKKATVNKTAKKAVVVKETAKSKTVKKSPAAEKKEVKKKAEVKSKAVKPALEEQIKIIDTFIDKRPSISSRAVKIVENEQKDLSVDSTTFGEDLVSENLAQILIEQGRNEKAIDIYKKLIWKFPQKKSYFAAQIEALTK